MQIRDLVKQSHFSRDTIRYYEKLGLIEGIPTPRSDNNYKQYSAQVLARLQHIDRLKHCGFTLKEIKNLLVVNPDQSVCADLPAQVADKIAAIEEKIQVLRVYKQSLMQIAQQCAGDCAQEAGLPTCIGEHGTAPSSCC